MQLALKILSTVLPRTSPLSKGKTKTLANYFINNIYIYNVRAGLVFTIHCSVAVGKWDKSRQGCLFVI